MTELGPKKFHLSQGQWEEAEGRGREGDPMHGRVGTKKVPSITGSVGGGGGKGEGGRSHAWQSWLSVFPLPAAFVLPSAFVSVYILTVLIFPPACELIRPSKRN